MPVAPACPVVPTATEPKRLKKMAYGHKTEHRLRVRAQIVLHAARGRSNARIAHETGLHLDTVRAWRGRFAHGGLPAASASSRRCAVGRSSGAWSARSCVAWASVSGLRDTEVTSSELSRDR
ncbi:helix-turn-helix domain-containing protein [Streptomyces canus]|uniref:helix-turn-helix domain-containing protein n=1 Tax=Streptomyces canus TaxID=58343 RepID=UPI0027D8DFA3|nr:helix-turn-helix domain-containing protein [Streptomyces canus]